MNSMQNVQNMNPINYMPPPNAINPIPPINVINPVSSYPNSQQSIIPNLPPNQNPNQITSQYYPPSSQTNILSSQVTTKKKISTIDQGTSPD